MNTDIYIPVKSNRNQFFGSIYSRRMNQIGKESYQKVDFANQFPKSLPLRDTFAEKFKGTNE